MINIRSAKKFCCEDISKIENYQIAIADDTQTYDIHHRRETDEHKSAAVLISEGLYYGVPADDLIFLTKTEHTTLHNKNKSDETRAKLRVALSGENNPAKRPEVRVKMSENNCMHRLEVKQNHLKAVQSAENRAKIRAAKQGGHWWNNGSIMKFCKEAPDDSWKPGMLPRKSLAT